MVTVENIYPVRDHLKKTVEKVLIGIFALKAI